MDLLVRHRERAHWRELRKRNEARCRRLLDTAAPLVTDDLDWASVPDREIRDGVVECLVYMRDVEGFTDRDLVGLTAHRSTLGDPLIGEFLPLWRSEESGHTAALSKFLSCYAPRSTGDIPARQLPPPAEAPLHERVVARIGGPVGAVVVAAHMVWGAANELLTLNGYRLLARRCGHPVLQELLGRIAAQEARHYSFYLMQAEWRLSASSVARRVLPHLIRKSWTPVGVGEGYKEPTEFDQVLTSLASGDDGMRAIDRMDARFAALPGFRGSTIYRDATTKAVRDEPQPERCR